MISLIRTAQICSLVLAIMISTPFLCHGQADDKRNVLKASVDENTAVRFFYHPPGDYFHFPLVFRAVDPKDSRLNTAPMTPEGRTAYVSLPEMRELIRGLSHLHLSWQESESVESLQPFKKLEITDTMVITAVSSNGTAMANLDPKRICETLKPLDSALETPRALWEFQGFRLNYGCKVPGFKYGAYPDH